MKHFRVKREDRAVAVMQAAVAVLAVVVCIGGCAPVTFTKQRFEWEAYDKNEYVQTKEGITVEMHRLSEVPAEFFTNVQACNQSLVPVVKSTGQPVMERITLVPVGHIIDKVTITNHTDHVIRLNQAVLRLFDPAGNQAEALDYEQLQAALFAARPCPTTQYVVPQLKLLKLYGRNVEIVPGTSFTGFLVFHPNTIEMAGMWKVALYEIPVRTDDAGRVKKTTQFEIRSVAKQYTDYYQRKNAIAPAVLQRSEAGAN